MENKYCEQIMGFTDLYYNCICGYKCSESDRRKTSLFFSYLEDSNIPRSDIYRVVTESPKKEFLDFNDLPDWLWTNSLLNKGDFYFHRELRLESPAPKFNVLTGKTEYNFRLEMKIIYTVEDLLSYINNVFKSKIYIEDNKRDLGLVNYYLNRFCNNGFNVDALLYVIDYSASESCDSLDKICNYEQKAIAEYIKHVNQAKADKANIIVWRK